jgi:magnesium transporter
MSLMSPATAPCTGDRPVHGVLPLTFICGVYGMNFRYLPELQWRYGYFAFWAVAGGLALWLLWMLRRHRMV